VSRLTMTRPLAIGTRPTRSRSATAAIIALMAVTQSFLALSRALRRDARYRAQTVIKAKHQASQHDLPSKCGVLVTVTMVGMAPTASSVGVPRVVNHSTAIELGL